MRLSVEQSDSVVKLINEYWSCRW